MIMRITMNGARIPKATGTEEIVMSNFNPDKSDPIYALVPIEGQLRYLVDTRVNHLQRYEWSAKLGKFDWFDIYKEKSNDDTR